MTNHVFTDAEIQEILNLINTTRHTQYIGARYVPIFGRKGETSIEWDNSAPYESLTIVLHKGNSYTSRQHTPAGIDITNTEYWAETGNYNAQIEQYRQEAQNGEIANALLAHMGITDNATAENHINKIEQNHNDTLSNTNALTSLNAETVDKAKNLFNGIVKYYDTVNALKNDTLINIYTNKIVATHGYHNINDNGGSHYIIRPVTDDDVIDDMTIISLPNSLVAELVITVIMNVKQFGAYGDNTNDDTLALTKAFNTTSIALNSNDTYKVTDSILINPLKNITIYGNNATINNILPGLDINKNRDVIKENLDAYTGDENTIKNNNTNVYIENLNINGGYDNTKTYTFTANTNSGIYIASRKNATLINVHVKNTIGNSIDIRGCQTVLVKNCIMENVFNQKQYNPKIEISHNGITVFNNGYWIKTLNKIVKRTINTCVIDNCTIQNIYEEAIQASAKNCKITNIYAKNIGQYCIEYPKNTDENDTQITKHYDIQNITVENIGSTFFNGVGNAIAKISNVHINNFNDLTLTPTNKTYMNPAFAIMQNADIADVYINDCTMTNNITSTTTSQMGVIIANNVKINNFTCDCMIPLTRNVNSLTAKNVTINQKTPLNYIILLNGDFNVSNITINRNDTTIIPFIDTSATNINNNLIIDNVIMNAMNAIRIRNNYKNYNLYLNNITNKENTLIIKQKNEITIENVFITNTIYKTINTDVTITNLKESNNIKLTN